MDFDADKRQSPYLQSPNRIWNGFGSDPQQRLAEWHTEGTDAAVRFCRQAIAESGLQVIKVTQSQIACKEASATKLNAWGGVAQAVTMQVSVSKTGENTSAVAIGGSVLGWFPGHVDGRVGALQNMIVVVAKRHAESQSQSEASESVNAKDNFVDELERLSKMHKELRITDDEFRQAKARLIG